MKIADAPEQMDKSEDKKGYIKKNDPDFGGIAKALPSGYWTSTPHGWINKDDGRKGVWAIIGHSSALRYDDAYLHLYGIRPVVTVDKINF